MNYVFLRYVFLSDCDFMARRKEEIRFGRKPKKTPIVGVKIPQACLKCAWKENRTTIAKVKCHNKDAKVLQEEGEWVCYSFTTYVSMKERERKEERR